MINQETDQKYQKAPKLFYGYIIIIAAFIIMLVAYGLFNIFGVFLAPLTDEFGWPRAVTSGAFSLSMIISGVLGVVMGGLNDRFGPRIILTISGWLMGIGFLLMSRVVSVWQLYLFAGVIVGVGAAGIWIPLLSSVARWFVTRRSLMTGFVIAGSGIGILIEPPLISRLISVSDWRLTYIIMGGSILLVVTVISQFMRRDPGQMGQMTYGAHKEGEPGLKSGGKDFTLREAVPTSQFWLIISLFFCLGFALFAYMIHIVPHAIKLGISPISAANIFAVMGGMNVIGNFVLGNVGDRIGNRRLFIIGLIVWIAVFILLANAGEIWVLYLTAAVFGLTNGGMGASESPIVARTFGLSSHGLIFGVVGLGFTAGAAVGPLVMGYVFDITGGYETAFWICTFASVIGLILSLILRPTKRLGIRL